ncbi:hypothetical protein PHISP_01076 [Aspergillus sp. HF37]|nr:hypothetical protein PHISP_01076 [Aspergillus sp. HF37]
MNGSSRNDGEVSRAIEESPDQQLHEQEAGNHPGDAFGTNGSIPPAAPTESTTEDPLRCTLHPWGMVDYHLYLAMAEKRSFHGRGNCMYFINDDGCYPASERDIFDSIQHFEPGNVLQQNPKLLFNVLPIPLGSGNGRVFGTREYVLGFEYTSNTFFARHFNPAPSPGQLWANWDLGTDMHSISIADLLGQLRTFFAGGWEAGEGILSSSPYSRSLRRDEPGFEVVIVTLFSQWVIDMADLVFDSNGDGAFEEAIEELRDYTETCRLVLQRASWRAWFALRDGIAVAEYRRRLTIEGMVSIMYSFA